MKTHQDLTPIQLPVTNGSLDEEKKSITRRIFKVSIANVGIAIDLFQSAYETEIEEHSAPRAALNTALQRSRRSKSVHYTPSRLQDCVDGA